MSRRIILSSSIDKELKTKIKKFIWNEVKDYAGAEISSTKCTLNEIDLTTEYIDQTFLSMSYIQEASLFIGTKDDILGEGLEKAQSILADKKMVFLVPKEELIDLKEKHRIDEEKIHFIPNSYEDICRWFCPSPSNEKIGISEEAEDDTINLDKFLPMDIEGDIPVMEHMEMDVPENVPVHIEIHNDDVEVEDNNYEIKDVYENENSDEEKELQATLADVQDTQKENFPNVNEKKERMRKEKYEQKIIQLREYMVVPAWKKRKLDHKVIGVWSPLHRIGVTTFIMNFSLFLAQYSLSIGVIEGISHHLKLKSLLSRYSGNSNNQEWCSYASYLEDDGELDKVLWKFQDVFYFPLEERDLKYKWDVQLLNYYMEGLKFLDLLLVDLPTGKMAPYTTEILNHIDEIWIITNNEVMEFLEWKDYIHSTLPIHKTRIVFNEEIKESKPQKLAEKLEIPLLVSLPSLYYESAANAYEKYPLYLYEGVQEKLDKGFENILNSWTKHLKRNEQSRVENSQNTIKNFLKRWKL